MNANKKNNLSSLISEIDSLKRSLLNLNFKKSTGQLEKTSEIKKIKRKVASLKTKINLEKGKIDA